MLERFATNDNASMLSGRREIRLLRRVVFPTNVSAFVITRAHLSVFVCVCYNDNDDDGNLCSDRAVFRGSEGVWRTIRHCG